MRRLGKNVIMKMKALWTLILIMMVEENKSVIVVCNIKTTILRLCIIYYSTQLNHFFLPFFVQNKVNVMICCLNMMDLSLKMIDLYFLKMIDLYFQQADRGCAAVDVFVGGEGAFGQKGL